MRAEAHKGPILLLLGGNLGDVRQNGEWVLRELSKKLLIIKASGWYSSPSWGFDGPDFLNKVVEVSGEMDPHSLLEFCQSLERTLGRIRSTEGYSSRLMDIDILYFGDLVLNEQRLSVPHPKIQERRFTLVPLNEHWKQWRHPILHKTQKELLLECHDHSEVNKVEL